MKRKEYLLLFITILFILLIFKNWFINENIIGGDFPFFYKESINNLSIVPPSWSGVHGNGLGGKIISYNIDSYLYITSFFGTKVLNLPWNYVYKLFWFAPFLIICFLSSYFLGRKILEEKSYAIISSLIYSTNTYILMIVGGGQMGFAIAYALVPLVILGQINLLDKINVKDSIFLGVVFGILMIFDIRVFYVSLIFSLVTFLYKLFFLNSKRKKFFFTKNLFKFFVVALIILSMNFFWILPFIIFPFDPFSNLGDNYVSTESVRFFSFADISTTISLLHPNWPENVFGKISFLRAEFLVLPLIAFVSLVAIKSNKNKNYILCFILISLLGVFLSKGTNPPLGELYELLYINLPGFKMFRDPTKWYILIAISYSILIPISLYFIGNQKIIKKFRLDKIILILFIVIWAYLIRESLMGKIRGTFESKEIPNEYIDFKNELLGENIFYRTLWIPKQQRFAYVSENHPSIEASSIFNATNAAELREKFEQNITQKYLEKLSVKYIVIPYDTNAEIFVEDGKFNEKKRDEFEKMLNKLTWIRKTRNDKLTIYEMKNFNSLFEINDGKIDSFTRVSPSEYKINFNSPKETNIIFSQNYSKNWKGFINKKEIHPSKTKDNLMFFGIPKSENDELHIKFVQESTFRFGWIMTAAATFLITIFCVLQSLRFKKK